MRTIITASIVIGALGLTACDSPPPARTVDVTVDDQGFHPNNVTAEKGEKLTLRFKRTSDDTCAKEVAFPDIDLKKPLPMNQAVAVEVPTDQARTLAFQCGMGMYKSSVVVN